MSENNVKQIGEQDPVDQEESLYEQSSLNKKFKKTDRPKKQSAIGQFFTKIGALIVAVVIQIYNKVFGKGDAMKVQNEVETATANAEGRAIGKRIKDDLKLGIDKDIKDKDYLQREGEHAMKEVGIKICGDKIPSHVYQFKIELANGTKYTLYADRHLQVLPDPVCPDRIEQDLQRMLDKYNPMSLEDQQRLYTSKEIAEGRRPEFIPIEIAKDKGSSDAKDTKVSEKTDEANKNNSSEEAMRLTASAVYHGCTCARRRGENLITTGLVGPLSVSDMDAVNKIVSDAVMRKWPELADSIKQNREPKDKNFITELNDRIKAAAASGTTDIRLLYGRTSFEISAKGAELDHVPVRMSVPDETRVKGAPEAKDIIIDTYADSHENERTLIKAFLETTGQNKDRDIIPFAMGQDRLVLAQWHRDKCRLLDFQRIGDISFVEHSDFNTTNDVKKLIGVTPGINGSFQYNPNYYRQELSEQIASNAWKLQKGGYFIADDYVVHMKTSKSGKNSLEIKSISTNTKVSTPTFTASIGPEQLQPMVAGAINTIERQRANNIKIDDSRTEAPPLANEDRNDSRLSKTEYEEIMALLTENCSQQVDSTSMGTQDDFNRDDSDDAR